ncbi:solute carrier family 23 protein [Agrococcus sp. Marseille-Q4369]|uniref:uracil-xanthine permease family protein n=1 Tax=Agrococcus sp. Marseille-Q4369 TaxID=2810513 RepID=UPI001B8C7D82|nr:solute carrier family 23 protein [Agrococcus sp. Marseille-Q4369]QUW17766.1 nitrate reductase [Agrococcus sp. Marseille-Q4369]
MFTWRLRDASRLTASDLVLPEERLAWPRTIGLGMQHVVAMFGATFLVPIITGFPPSTTLLFSGLGTMLFLLITKNRLPSYLGSSFAFLAPIGAATEIGGPGFALSGVILVGLLLALVGVVVHFSGTRWIGAVMPPVVSGTIVALIGFNLAPAARDNFVKDPLLAAITLLAIVVTSVLFRGMVARLAILLGVVLGYVIALLTGRVDPDKLEAIEDAAWIGLPTFTSPTFDPALLPAILMFVPVVLPLVAENLGHVKGVGQLLDRDLDPLAGRALFADGIATTIAGTFGGSPTTTYGENIGVMSATRVFSTAAYWIAAITAVLLGLSPKVGAVIFATPDGVLGGVTTALYGLIGIIGVRIWVENKVDFSIPRNQFAAGVGLIVAIADFTLASGQISFGGIVLGTVATLVIYHLMAALERLRGRPEAARDDHAPPATTTTD